MNKTLRILLWIIGIFSGLVVLAAIAVKLFFPLEKAKALAIEKSRAALGREVAVGEVDVSLWGGIGLVLNNVSIGNPPNFGEGQLATIERVDVKLAFWPLLSGEISAKRIAIEHPTITLRVLSDGRNNFTFAAVDSQLPAEAAEQLSPEAKAAAPAVAFDRCDITSGYLTYQNDSTQQEVGALDLNLRTSLKNPTPGIYSSSGKLDIDTLTASHLSTIPSLSVDLTYEATYDNTARLLEISKARMIVNNVTSDISLKLDHSPETFSVSGSVTAADVAMPTILSLIPAKYQSQMSGMKLDGTLGVKADFAFQPSATDSIKYHAEVVANGVAVSHGKIPGELRFGTLRLSVEKEHAGLIAENSSFNGKPLKLHMSVDSFSNPNVTAEIGGQLDLALIQPFLPAAGTHVIGGTVDVEAKMSGRIKDIKNSIVTGRIRTLRGHYSSSILPEPIDSFTLDVSFNQEVVRVDKLTGTMKSGSLSFAGRVNGLYEYLLADSTKAISLSPEIDGKLDVSGNLAMAQPYLPPAGQPKLGGTLKLSAKVQGPLKQYEQIRPHGSLTIHDAFYEDSLLPEPIKKLDADFLISPETLSVTSMTVTFVSSDVSMKGKLTNPFPYLLPSKELDRSHMTKPLFLFVLSSRRFNFDKLFPEAVPGAGEDGSRAIDSVSPIILPDINGRGSIAIDTLIYSRVEFTEITGQVRIFDRRIECSNVAGKAYTGTVTGNTTIDLSNFAQPHYVGEFKGSHIEANDFVDRFTPLGGILFGKIDLSGKYNAVGWEPSEFLNSLTLDGKGSTQNARLVTGGFAFDAINSVAAKLGKDVSKELSLKSLVSNVVVKDGAVSFDNLKTVLGDIGDLEMSGGYKFSGGLAYSGTVLLSREWSDKLMKTGLIGDIGSFLGGGSSDRVKLPISIAGSMDKPTLKIDYASVASNVKSSLKKEAGGLLDGLLKKK